MRALSEEGAEIEEAEEEGGTLSAARASIVPRLAHVAMPSNTAASPAAPATGAVSLHAEAATFTVTSPWPLALKASRACAVQRNRGTEGESEKHVVRVREGQSESQRNTWLE
jgi:hypothetical protein